MNYPPIEVTICDSCSIALKKPFIAERYCHKYGHPLRDCMVTREQLAHIKKESHD